MSVKSKRRACLLLAVSLILTVFSPVLLNNKASAEGINGTFLTGEESSSYVAKPDITEEIDNNNYISCDFSNAQRINDLFIHSETLSNTAVKPDGFTVSQKIENGALQIQNSITSGKYDTNARNTQLGYVYCLRNVYQKAQTSYITGELEFSESSNWNQATVALWLGETESSYTGIRLFKDGHNVGLNCISMNKTTGAISEKTDVRRTVCVNNTFGYKWKFEVAYTYEYSTNLYRYYFTLTNEDGTQGAPLCWELGPPSFASVRDLTAPLFGFSVATDSSGYVNIDNVTIEFDNEFEDDTAFLNKHYAAYHLQTETVSPFDKQKIQDFLSEYESLPLRDKYYLGRIKDRMTSCIEKIKELEDSGITDESFLRKSNDYSDWNENFSDESSLRKWRVCSGVNNLTGDFTNSATEYFTANASVVYDDVLNCNAMRLESAMTCAWGIKEETLPEKAVATTVKFKLRIESGNFVIDNRFIVYYTYNDPDNYEAFDFSKNKQGQWGVRYMARYRGDMYGFVGWTLLKDISFEDGVEFIITYKETSVQITIFQINNEDVSASFTRSLLSGKANPAVSPSMTEGYKASILISDWEMKLNKGTFVDDDTVSNPVVYYTGNTTYKAGETVLVSGEDLYDTVANVKVAEVTNVYEPQNAKYSFETAYDKGSKRAKAAYFETADDYSGLVWEDVRILQWTQDSFKFRIPERYNKNGIYAMKITGRNGSESYYYINEPEIDYAVGDEGKSCTPGGELQLVGKMIALNMKENGGQNVAVQIRNAAQPSEAKIYTVADGDITVDSEYSIIWKVPAALLTGKYEISVYNGFGDNNSWSEPYAFEVINPIRDSWGLNTATNQVYTIDITSLGATGVREQNATEYFVKAFELLEENGGGILYIPNGWYQLQFSIVVPENVQVIGESEDQTIIFFMPFYFQYYRMPTYAIGFNSNVSFENLTIFSTRLSYLFKCFESERGENVYFKNVLYDKATFHGTPTQAATGGVIINGYQFWEIYLRVLDEQRNTGSGPWHISKPITNFQVDNFDSRVDGNMNISGYWESRDYSKIQNCDWDMIGFSGMAGSHTIYANNTYNHVSQSLNGNGVYYTGCTFENSTQNNQEFLVADEGLSWGANNSGIITKVSSTVWQMKNKEYNTDKAIGLQLCVVSGQGAGQTRWVVGNAGSRLQLDQPFEVDPNANSRVILCTARADHLFYNNKFHNGASGAYFGNVVGTTYDSNTHTRHGNFNFWARVGMVNWYVTVKDSDLSEPQYLHGTGVGSSDQSGMCGIIIYSRSGINGTKGIMIKNNQLDGYYIELYTTDSPNSMIDYIIEFNNIENVKKAIICNASHNTTDGMYIYGNTYNNVDTPFNMALKKAGYNKQKSPVVIYEDYNGTAQLIKGDVNLDGQITIKDITLIRYYLIGATPLSDTQLKNADVYPDGKVTAKDATIIRNYILGNITSFDGITADSEAPSIPTESEESSSSSSGSGEDPSSSGTSSGSTSSGGTSSGSTSSGSTSSGSTSSDGEWIPGRY